VIALLFSQSDDVLRVATHADLVEASENRGLVYYEGTDGYRRSGYVGTMIPDRDLARGLTDSEIAHCLATLV
jgi:hypothetical protein